MPNNKSVVFSAQNVSKTFGAGKNLKTAVDNVSFDIYDGEIISIVGGSGCGKSVLAKIMLGLYQPSNGTFLYRDHQIKNLKNHWNEVQSVFQDPFSCFNQFFSIRSQLEDSLNILKDKPSKEEVKARLDHQMSRELKLEKATVVIENNGNIEELHKKIDLLLERI